MKRYFLDRQELLNVHDESDCNKGSIKRPCVIHRPTAHHMSTWQLIWRNDRGIFERICPHGVGHPDPDQFAYWQETDSMYEAVHGCDGCCREENHVAD